MPTSSTTKNHITKNLIAKSYITKMGIVFDTHLLFFDDLVLLFEDIESAKMWISSVEEQALNQEQTKYYP